MFKPTVFNKGARKPLKPTAPTKPSFTIDQDDIDDEEQAPRSTAFKKKKIAPQAQRTERPMSPQEASEMRRAESVRTKALAPLQQAKPTTAVAVVPPSGPLMTKRAEKYVRTKFGDKAEIVIQQLEEQDTDGAVSLLTRSLLQMLVDLLPVAEHNVRDTKGTKGIYQLNQMVSSVREMLTDLQSLRDKGLLGHRIVERTVRPAFMDIGGQFAMAFVGLEASARTYMSPEDFHLYKQTLDNTKRSLAQYMEAQYAEIRDQVIASLS